VLPRYAELHCKSNFSFLTGASHPEELIERAAELGYGALALTDECSLAGVVRAHAEAKGQAQGQRVHFIVGSEMRLVQAGSGEPHARLVLLAMNRRGYGNLSHWITVARRRAEKGTYLAHPGDVEGKVPNAPMLAGLPGCLALLVPAAGQTFETVFAQAMWLKTWFQDRAAIALELLHRAGDDELVERIGRVAAFTELPVAAAGDVLMHVRSRKPLQDVLAATRLGKPVAECGTALEPNAEQHLRPRSRLASLYQPEWLEATMRLAARCAFSLDELKYQYPHELVPPGETPTSHLRRLAEEGAVRRFAGKVDKAGVPLLAKYGPQIEEELAIIATLRYEPYFLTVAEIVQWAKDQRILCQGRGSAANSLVCYCLGVTEVDPERATMLFGRFISVERNEVPDIDIDFEHQRREEVIQHIYRKYGRHRAALTAVVISYRPRSALRDAGRALGIDLQRIEAVSKSQHWFDGRRIAPERLLENGFEPTAPVVELWMELTSQLVGFPRHFSQHPGGFVLARDSIEEFVPVEPASMDDRSIVQWDKDDLDTLGILKVDILAIGMLSAIRRSLDILAAQRGVASVPMHTVPDEDPATYDMICKADTVGVFQIESRAQMSMLPRLKPRTYYDLVVEVAIVRPGPIQGGMVHPYLHNRTLPYDAVDCPEELKPALARTRGVPIFQEQVMQIAMLAADFTAGEADALRRAMAAWKRRGGLSPFHKRLVDRMVEKGYTLEYAERIFKQIQGFGEYGFPESHAAGFALLAYVSSWLKCHHPDAFLCGLLNAQPMGFYAPAQLVRDARLHGVAVQPVCIVASAVESTMEGAGAPQAVRLGLNRVKGLDEASAGRIVAARAEAPFATVEDLSRRARLDAKALGALARANALQAIAGHRFQAAWAVAGVDTRPTEMLRATRTRGGEHEPVPLAAPSDAQATLADYRSVGLTLGRHPVALVRERLAAFRILPAAVLHTLPHGRLARASGLVTHRQRPETAKGTVFVTLEDETGAVNVIVWPRVADQQRQPLLGATLLTVYGTWQKQGEGDTAVMHLLAARMVDHTPLLAGLSTKSRDFR
jgi:error-prone DNA polymerase